MFLLQNLLLPFGNKGFILEAIDQQNFTISSSNQCWYLHKFQTFHLMYSNTRYDFFPSFIANVIEKWNVEVKMTDFYIIVNIIVIIIIIIVIIIIIIIIFNLKREKSSFVNP